MPGKVGPLIPTQYQADLTNSGGLRSPWSPLLVGFPFFISSCLLAVGVLLPTTVCPIAASAHCGLPVSLLFPGRHPLALEKPLG